MSRLIVRIEKVEKPLVVRQECTADQRAMYIYLTDEGKRVIDLALETYNQLINKVDLDAVRALIANEEVK